VSYRGCWYFRYGPIGSFEGIKGLRDEPTRRERPVGICGQAVMRLGYKYFGIALGGYCLSGSHRLSNYHISRSYSCKNYRGNYFNNQIMDVFQITNTRSFSDSVVQSSNGTANTTSPVEDNSQTEENPNNSGYVLTCCLWNMLLACIATYLVL